MGLRSKERQRNGLSIFCLHKKWGESQNKGKRGRERGRKEMLVPSLPLPKLPLAFFPIIV